MTEDYYALLGVERDATAEEVKRAFRALARQYHPDAAGADPEAEARFKEIARAYETLSDPAKRARYDRFGPEGVGSAGADPFTGVGLSDLFDAFFGGDPFGARRDAPGGRHGPDVEVRLDLSFTEALFGTERTIEVRLPVECETCEASGCSPGTYPETCGECGGAGEVREVRRSILGQIVSARVCARCRGVGREIRSPCSDCGGDGRVTRERRIQVEVPAGIDDGQRLRLNARGAAGPRGAPPGDLYVDVSVASHPDFERSGDDLVCVVTVPVASAVLGTALELRLPAPPGSDGSGEGAGDRADEIEIEIPPGTQHGTTFRTRGRGVPRLGRSGRGDLVVVVEVEVPTRLSAEEDALYREIAALRGEVVEPRERPRFWKLRSAFH